MQYDPKQKKIIIPRTNLSPEEEEKFQVWRRSLPINLQVDDSSYDLRGAWRAELKPILVDGEYHLQSRDPKTGLILKSELHPSFHLTLKGEAEAGYELYRDPNTQRLYSRKKKD